MKHTLCFSILFLCLILTKVSIAQSHEQCIHCSMAVKNLQFKAQAQTQSGKLIWFDAIECLVNYLKSKNENVFQKIQVTDYNSGKVIDAANAYYLKSKAIPSPMGANLSAYMLQSEAISVQKEKGGDVYNWETLKERFIDSEFGAYDSHHDHHNRPDAYGPSGMMGDHLHPKGGFMLSLRYMNMYMNGNREGSSEISDESIYERYMVAPQNMTMQMFMLGVMYAPSDKLTLILMQNFATKNMDLTARMTMANGMQMLNSFSTNSGGVGDMKVGALLGLYNRNEASFHLNGGLNIPLGDITNRDNTPMMNDVKLPYAMQLGSGTWDITLGITFKKLYDKFSLGIQQLNTLRTGTNSEGYRFGNLYKLHTWGAYAISQYVSTSLRLSGSIEGELNGEDSELNPMMVTTADPNNYGGDLVHGALGFNFLLAGSKLILGAEIGIPLYQNYNGIFMNEKFGFNGSAKYNVF